MTAAPDPFYVPYGTLPPDALSYVTRRAADELYQWLMQGEFCYILTPRQMGKSPLMVRTIARLREEGVDAAVRDLSALGAELTAVQWYNSLLLQLGRRLDLQEEMEGFCLEHDAISPLQRWQRA